MSSWSTRVWDDWLKNGTPHHDSPDSDTFVEPYNFKDAVQFRTVVLAVEIDEPTTKKIRERNKGKKGKSPKRTKES